MKLSFWPSYSERSLSDRKLSCSRFGDSGFNPIARKLVEARTWDLGVPTAPESDSVTRLSTLWTLLYKQHTCTGELGIIMATWRSQPPSGSTIFATRSTENSRDAALSPHGDCDVPVARDKRDELIARGWSQVTQA